MQSRVVGGMAKTSWLLSSTALIGLVALDGGGASAAELCLGSEAPSGSLQLPAVSAVNAKFDLRGGWWSDVEVLAAVGSVSVPLGHSFGFQADGLIGTIDGTFAAAAGGHLFW